jgi:MFS transporter, OFA family, oxalate/formate antiporter
MSENLGWSQAQVTLGYSFMMAFYALTAFFSGWILDRWGTKPVYIIAAGFGAAGFIVTSFVHSLLAYYAAYGVLSGIATGMLWVSSTVSVRKWYVGNDYAKMWGIAFAGAPMAQVLLSLTVKGSLSSASGDAWRGSMQLLGGITLVALFIAAFLAKRNPEDYGMQAFGELPSRGGAPKKEKVWGIKSAFSTYPIWGVVLTFLLSMLAEFLIWTQVVSYWHADLGMALTSATNLYIAVGVVGIFSMPLMGIVADRVVKRVNNEARGRKIMLIFGPATGIIACVFLLLQTPSTLALGLIACFIFAVYWAIVPGGVVGYTGAVYGRKTLGKIWGLATLIVMGIGPFVGPLVGGYLKDTTGTYTGSIIFAMCAFGASTLLATTLPLSASSKTAPEKHDIDITSALPSHA